MSIWTILETICLIGCAVCLAVAAVLAVVAEGVLIAWYMIDQLAFSNAFPTLIGKLSLFEQFYTFINGVLDLRSVVYLVSVCVFFVYLTVQSLEKRRWSE